MRTYLVEVDMMVDSKEERVESHDVISLEQEDG